MKTINEKFHKMQVNTRFLTYGLERNLTLKHEVQHFPHGIFYLEKKNRKTAQSVELNINNENKNKKTKKTNHGFSYTIGDVSKYQKKKLLEKQDKKMVSNKFIEVQ